MKTSAPKERYLVSSCVVPRAPGLITYQDHVARRAYIQSEVTETLRAFYCAVCEKQFQKVAQFDEHCNSYAHHHKIRFKEMQSNERAKANSQEAIEKRREKERKREEKELRKAAKAAGVKLSTVTPLVPTPTIGIESGPGQSEKQSKFATGGWSTINSSSSGGGFKKPGWTTVSSPQKPRSPPPPEPSQVGPNLALPTSSASGFRSGGWTTLEGPPSASTVDRPLTPNRHHLPPPPPPPEEAPIPHPPEPSTSKSGLEPIPVGEMPVEVQPKAVSRSAKNTSGSKRAESSRSGWQSFSRGGSRR